MNHKTNNQAMLPVPNSLCNNNTMANRTPTAVPARIAIAKLWLLSKETFAPNICRENNKKQYQQKIKTKTKTKTPKITKTNKCKNVEIPCQLDFPRSNIIHLGTGPCAVSYREGCGNNWKIKRTGMLNCVSKKWMAKQTKRCCPLRCIIITQWQILRYYCHCPHCHCYAA